MLKGKQAFFMRTILSLSPCNLLKNIPIPYFSDIILLSVIIIVITNNFYQINLLTMSSLSVKRLIIDSPGCSLPNLVYSLLSLFVTQSEAYTNIGVAPESACAKSTRAHSVASACAKNTSAVRFRRAPIN